MYGRLMSVMAVAGFLAAPAMAQGPMEQYAKLYDMFAPALRTTPTDQRISDIESMVNGLEGTWIPLSVMLNDDPSSFSETKMQSWCGNGFAPVVRITKVDALDFRLESGIRMNGVLHASFNVEYDYAGGLFFRPLQTNRGFLAQEYQTTETKDKKSTVYTVVSNGLLNTKIVVLRPSPDILIILTDGQPTIYARCQNG